MLQASYSWLDHMTRSYYGPDLFENFFPLIDRLLFSFRARGKSGGRIYKALTFREVEYLEFIRKRDIALFGEVVEKLQKKLFGEDSPLPPPPHAQDVPLYPSLPHKQMDDEV